MKYIFGLFGARVVCVIYWCLLDDVYWLFVQPIVVGGWIWYY